MTRRVRFPIRIKFMLALVVVVTAAVSFITFSTANLFQEDKRTYINGLTSMVALGAAEEARSLLEGYRERLVVYARIMAESSLNSEERAELSQNFFGDFPQLIGVSMRYGEGEPTTIFDTSVLDDVELSAQDFHDFEQAHPLPLERIRKEPFVRNVTLSDQLPAMMLAYSQPTSHETEPLLVTAIVQSDHLLALAARFSGYHVFLVDSEGTLLADSDPSRVVERRRAVLPDELQAMNEKFTAGITLEYEEDGEPMIGGFANVDFGGLLAAAKVPRTAAYLASRTLVNRLISVSAVLLVLAVLVGLLWANRLARPLERLSAATLQIGRGEFDVRVGNESRDEIGALAGSFNRMASELKARDEDLQEAQFQLIQSEKMAAFGQLGAGIAHEVKNPLAGILACAQLAQTEVENGSQIQQDLQLIEKETRRCKDIIQNILKFARQEKALMEQIEINQALEDAIAIIKHQLDLSKVKLETCLEPELPLVVGNSNQLQQVFMNLMINAQQAMDSEPGSLKITSCRLPSGEIELRFTDSGPGMNEETKAKLFEPFYTTKPNGKGTGLGLSVSFGIVTDHGGKISVESEPGSGAEFVIVLPAVAGSTETGSESPAKALNVESA